MMAICAPPTGAITAIAVSNPSPATTMMNVLVIPALADNASTLLLTVMTETYALTTDVMMVIAIAQLLTAMITRVAR